MSKKSMYTIDSIAFEDEVLLKAKQKFPSDYSLTRNERVTLIRKFLNSIGMQYVIFKRARYKKKISVDNLKKIIQGGVKNTFIVT